MKKIHGFIILVISFTLSNSLMAQETTDVFVNGLRIVGPGHGLNGSELVAFNQQSGISLALLVKMSESKNIVEIETRNCNLIEFTDNTNYNMLDRVHWDSFPDISKDGRTALIEVSSRRIPSENATKLHITGKIQMRLAATSLTQKIKNLLLQAGTNATFDLETIQVMKAQIDDENLTLVLQISRELKDNMQEIRFFAPDGNPLECWGQGSFSFGNAAQMEYNLDTKTIPEYLNLEIDIWQKLETVNVPFDIQTEMGFVHSQP